MPRMKGEIARPSRLKLLMRRQRRNLRLVAVFAAGFGVLLAGGMISHSAQRGGTIASMQERLGKAIDLRVTGIDVKGRANTPEPLLRAALGVSVGDPILGFSVEGARSRIESLSWVEHVAVERRLPGTIVVDLVERRPFAIWQNGGKFQLIDRAGNVVDNEDVSAFSELPLVVGLDVPAHAAAMLDALSAQPSIKNRVGAIVRVGERRWNLQLNNGITVMLPEGHETVALQRLAELQADQSLLDRPLVFVDMRLPDRLAVRARQPAAGAPPSGPGLDGAGLNGATPAVPGQEKPPPEKSPAEPSGRRAT
jgi:cell division protein FtsQ